MNLKSRKLCEADVRLIKFSSQHGTPQKRTPKQLARVFGVSPKHIRRIIQGKMWGSVK